MGLKYVHTKKEEVDGTREDECRYEGLYMCVWVVFGNHQGSR